MSGTWARVCRIAALLLLACAVSVPVSAQAPVTDSSPPPENVVVTAPQADFHTEILRFVRGHARLSRIDQLARWRDPICVRVLNLPAGYRTFIANRVKEVAREAGAPIADSAECAPNVSIIFTPEPQAVLDRVRADNPELLGFHFIGQREAVATMTRPIQAWYLTGTAATYAATGGQFGGPGTYVDDPMHPPPQGQLGSRLGATLQSVFMHVLIIVDQNAVADAPVGPIADYLSVIALTQVAEESWNCGGLVTILERFSDCATAPETLTGPDKAFLHGLYTMDGRSFGTLQRAHIRNGMSGALQDEETEATSTERH